MLSRKLAAVELHVCQSAPAAGAIILRLRWAEAVHSKKRVFILGGKIYVRRGWVRVTPVEKIAAAVIHVIQTRKTLPRRGKELWLAARQEVEK